MAFRRIYPGHDGILRHPRPVPSSLYASIGEDGPARALADLPTMSHAKALYARIAAWRNNAPADQAVHRRTQAISETKARRCETVDLGKA